MWGCAKPVATQPHGLQPGSSRSGEPTDGGAERLEDVHESLDVLAAVIVVMILVVNRIRAAAVPDEFVLVRAFHGNLILLTTAENLPRHHAPSFTWVGVPIDDAEVVWRRRSLPVWSWKEEGNE